MDTDSLSTAHVLVAVPTMGTLHPLLVSRLLHWSKKYGNLITFYFTFRLSPVDRARNNVVKYFLETEINGKPFTHLLFIDSDTIPPVDALDKLLSHDKPFVTGLTPILKYNTEDHSWATFDNCFLGKERQEDGQVKTYIAKRNTGLQEINRCGAACMLIKREVFDDLTEPYFEFIPNEDNTEHKRSEDINFCDKMKEAGYTLYADTSVACEHEKLIMI